MTTPLPTIEILNELFNYDPGTGILTRAMTMASNAKAGAAVGAVDRYGYLKARVMHKEFKVHRLIWKMIHGVDPVGEIDHIDGNPANNRADNLRLASRGENAHNTRLFRNNSSGHKGVSWDRNSGRWDAQLASGGRVVFRRTFIELSDAIEAIRAARERHHTHYTCHG